MREYRKARRANLNDSYAKDEQKRAHKYYVKVGRQRRDDWLNQFKTPCLKCGITDMEIICFHHINPTEKKLNIGSGALPKASREDIQEEIAKCVCLCANCHRKFHHKYGHKIENGKQALEEFIGKKIAAPGTGTSEDGERE